MPVWRCPHCATPQAEASRCWVCHRSTTSCVTCRFYRRGISGGLGLCGLDPRHGPVADTDVRTCWVSAPAIHGVVAEAPGAVRRAANGLPIAEPEIRAPRTFVPVESLVAGREAAATAVAVMDRVATDAAAPEAVVSAELEAPAAPVAATEPLPVMATPGPDRPIPGRWWLWGDPDPWPERVGERA